MPSRPVLVMADWEPPGTFDPKPPTTQARLRADTLVFGRLWIPDPAGRLVPDLAVSVPRPAAGGLTVQLRSGLRWSDGTPLTADAVVTACESQCAGITAHTLDARRVRFGTTDPRRLAMLFVAPPDANGTLASGPYRLAGSGPAELRFDRNPYYHGHPPYLAEIVELLPPSHDAMLVVAQAGEADYLPHLGPADLVSHFGALRLAVTPSEREEVLVPAGLDGRTLAALSAATDRQALSDQLYGGRAQTLGLPRQQALARFLLAGASPPVRLQTVCDDPLRAGEASLLSAQWTDVGMRVTDTPCASIDALAGAPPATGLALYSVLTGQVPPGAMPLLRRPAVRAVTGSLRGFAPNDTSGTDLWNVADWWLE